MMELAQCNYYLLKKMLEIINTLIYYPKIVFAFL